LNALPLIHRELLVASRRPMTWWIRVGTGLVGALGFLFIAGTTSLGVSQPGRVGPALFTILSIVAFLFAAFSGVRSAALPLCEENRENTLGLLLLTPLRRHELVLGRLAAGIMEGLGMLATFLPVLALVLLTGGVTAHQWVMSTITLAIMVLLSTAAGLYAGAMNAQDFKASMMTLLLVLVACLPTGWMVLALMMTVELDAQSQREFAFGRPAARSKGIVLQFLWLPLAALFLLSLLLAPAISLGSFASPAGMLLLSLNSGSIVLFGVQAVGALCLALALVWLTSRRLAVINIGVSGNHTSPATPETPDASRANDDDHASDDEPTTSGFRSSSRPSRLLEQAPLAWLLHPGAGLRRFLWFAAVTMSVTAFFPIFVAIDQNSVAPFFGGFRLPGALVWPVVNFLVGWQAARLFVESRRSRSIELLLVTPEFRTIAVRDVWRSLRAVLLKPLLLVWLAGLVGTLLAINLMPEDRPDIFDPAYGLPVYLLNSGRHLAGLAAMAWLGLWSGWCSRRPGFAAIQTFVIAFVVPAILFLPFSTTASTWSAEAMLPHALGIGLFLAIAFAARRALGRTFLAGSPPVELRRT
jgi:hypothetical protein